MLSFYWEVVQSVPRLAWNSFAGVEGWIAVVAFIATLFSAEIGQKVANWEGVDRRLAIVPVLLYFGYLGLEANYLKFSAHQVSAKAVTEELQSKIDKANNRVEIYSIEMEKLAVQNAELMRGAPVLTGKTAQVAAIRKELLDYADTAPQREGFNKKVGDGWLNAANTLVGFETSERRAGHFYVHNAWDGSYEDFARCVASLRALALDIRESDLPD